MLTIVLEPRPPSGLNADRQGWFRNRAKEVSVRMRQRLVTSASKAVTRAVGALSIPSARNTLTQNVIQSPKYTRSRSACSSWTGDGSRRVCCRPRSARSGPLSFLARRLRRRRALMLRTEPRLPAPFARRVSAIWFRSLARTTHRGTEHGSQRLLRQAPRHFSTHPHAVFVCQTSPEIR